MKRLSMMVAVWLLPTGAMAQGLWLDFEEPGFVPAAGEVRADGHPPSDTETSPARARSVRRGGRTTMLIDGGQPAAASAGTQMAAAGS